MKIVRRIRNATSLCLTIYMPDGTERRVCTDGVLTLTEAESEELKESVNLIRNVRKLDAEKSAR